MNTFLSTCYLQGLCWHTVPLWNFQTKRDSSSQEFVGMESKNTEERHKGVSLDLFYCSGIIIHQHRIDDKLLCIKQTLVGGENASYQVIRP